MALTKEYGLGEYTFPRGWFMVAEASEVKDKVLPVRFFGQEFALYRGKASGKVVLLDAFCPHMGTNMARNESSYVVRDGQIEGDSIRCPYHAWRFGPDGKCNDIPYSKAPIPKAAAVRSWPVVESLGAIFVWFDPEGGEPEWAAPSLKEWDDPQWIRWKFDHLGTLACHGQEVIDNIADCSHLNPVHGSEVLYYRNEFNGHLATQLQGGGHRTLVTPDGVSPILTTDTTYHGPGFLLSHMMGMGESIIFIGHTMVDDGVIKVWHALLVKSQHERPTEEEIVAAAAYQESARLAFAQDFDVWANKRPAIQILQVPGDGPFHKSRIWYKQFYNQRARKQEFLKQVEGVQHRVTGMPGRLEEAESAA
jgi:3-ketosteroid 9alpha-monooxygenase subunit A